MAKRISNIAIAGAGRMGRGIAVSFAWAGYPVALVDSEQRAPEAFAELAATTHAELLAECHLLAAAGIVPPAVADEIAARVDVVARVESSECLQAAEVVFEAVAEVLEIKQSTYAWLSEAVSETAILASTTSTMLADTLAGFVTHAERFTNAHWLNPAYLMPLVEISPAGVTRPDVVAELRALLEAVGKVPVECRTSPGYIVSRMQALVLNEAARLVEEGVASAEDIDRAMRTGFGTTIHGVRPSRVHRLGWRRYPVLRIQLPGGHHRRGQVYSTRYCPAQYGGRPQRHAGRVWVSMTGERVIWTRIARSA